MLAMLTSMMLVGMMLASEKASATKSYPRQLAPVFTEPNDVSVDAPQHADSNCAVALTVLEDARKSKNLVGVISKRAIRGPSDSNIWLDSMRQGLTRRGIVLNDGAGGKPHIRSEIWLQTAWMSQVKEAFAASTIFRVRTSIDDGVATEKIYRGSRGKGTYFANGTDVMQQAMDGAVADALDDIAKDWQAACAAPTSSLALKPTP